MNRKYDADRIKTAIEKLSYEYQHHLNKKLWPKFLFRVENVVAAANILETGRIFSRHSAIQNNISVEGSACQGILDHTAERWKKHVRLHFRPRTAYHFATEGIRPTEEIRLGAHCPVPVLFLFNAEDLLSRESTLFSDGNLSDHRVYTGEDADFFESIPFDLVYKDYVRTDVNYKKIKFHNQAEVMIPEELELAELRYILCRSQPEKDTLLSLLSEDVSLKWKGKIKVKSDWFCCMYKYVQSVNVMPGEVHINFSSGKDAEYLVQARLRDCNTGQVSMSGEEKRLLGPKLVLTRPGVHARNYEVELYVNSCLAYKKILLSDDAPF